nr:MAG TPA: hypothetical protein [Caudoviricetes sp.]
MKRPQRPAIQQIVWQLALLYFDNFFDMFLMKKRN